MRQFLVCAALILAGCNADPSDITSSTTATWKDPSTDCVYLFFDRGIGNARVASLTIRFRRDGKPDCPGSGEEKEIADEQH